MSRLNYVFTSKSVSEGHPDKASDCISDSVLDAFLSEEPNARVAFETFATTSTVVAGGEVGLSTEAKTKAMLAPVEGIVRDCVKDIGYEQDKFHWNTLKVYNLLHEQSAHIAQGVDRDGAGDQGIMFGYACRKTPEPRPLQVLLGLKIFMQLISRLSLKLRYLATEPTLSLLNKLIKGKLLSLMPTSAWLVK